jgi:arsenate reductase
MHKVTIYHNPKCGTSRNVLEMIREKGIEPEVILYLENPPTREKLLHIVKISGKKIRDFLREKAAPYDELDLGNTKWTDEQLLNFMMEHPILINRPIVVTAKGSALCRPKEIVLDLI